MDIRSILLIDDDPNIRKLARMSLEKVGHFHVMVAASGQEALDMILSPIPDVIVLDLMMPGLDGKQTLTRLKSNRLTSAVPVVLMTAKLAGLEMDELMSLGAAGVIIKPFDPLTLPQEIRKLVTVTSD
jgi:two-component system, OmpR family, response regulator